MKNMAVIIVLFLLSKPLFAQQHSNVLYGERDIHTDTERQQNRNIWSWPI